MNTRALAKLTIVILFLLAVACKKDKPELKHKVIADGCIPKKVVLDLDFLGNFEDHYEYEGDRLLSYGHYGAYELEYEDGLVSRVVVNSSRYEEYEYNDQCQVIRSLQYREDDPEEGFKLVAERVFEYENNRVVEIIDVMNDETDLLSYYPNTNNIDSIKTINATLELTELEVYEYDTLHHPQKNLPIPRLNYFHWVKKGFDNNIVWQKRIKFGDQTEITIWDYELEYNAFGYPTMINKTDRSTGFVSNTVITYERCE